MIFLFEFSLHHLQKIPSFIQRFSLIDISLYIILIDKKHVCVCALFDSLTMLEQAWAGVSESLPDIQCGVQCDVSQNKTHRVK